eukprot:CAMPEP_0113951770 /NCGR_PEP_ID=MMETSP1339-20121228/87794_1 /TAXON_ID=94617 /ORGANISM="Fibrocapsa japonica" /LENGTH=241 /DNA_ID=CAMNT_0000960125 /DNA_START=109 /DNA_END=834 /DNA_ORIENTATION=- /assembly_acc=CAM_ASM_000762
MTEATVVESARASGLALQLDEGTRKSHSVAENTAFVTGFFKGVSSREQFSRLVASLYFVYDCMEEAFDTCPDERVNALDYGSLRRKESLAEDMEFYFGPSWKETVSPSPATKKYMKHIQNVSKSEPYLLVAHQYTRYLGDLFGGQMMGNMARNSLGLHNEGGLGTRFYTFDSIKSTKQFIEEYYTKMNTLNFTEAEKEKIVEEANVVFRLNIELFDELEGNGFVSAIKIAFAAFKDKISGN